MKKIHGISKCFLGMVLCFVMGTSLYARSGSSVLTEKELEPFDQLVLSGVFNVELKTGNHEMIAIDCDEDLLKYVQIKNNKGKLTVKTDDAYKKPKSANIKIFITVTQITSLKIMGVGSVHTQNALISEDLDLVLSGVGQINLEIETKQFMGKVSAVGEIKLSGKSNNGTMTVSGVGNFDASEFKIENLFITNTGVGQVMVYASNELTLKSAGIGSVEYFGNPLKKNISNSGLGKVKQK